MSQLVAYRYLITGRARCGFSSVRLSSQARHHQLSGCANLSGQVAIQLQGLETAILIFEHDPITNAPPLARPHIVEKLLLRSLLTMNFVFSTVTQTPNTPVFMSRLIILPVMTALLELHTPSNRRYRYPFINCTNVVRVIRLFATCLTIDRIPV
ncbi:MAG: hypothetical protein R3E08_01265 [Thiotrichaceae bacterium]